MDREQIAHLASLYGSSTDKRPSDVHIACPFAVWFHRDGVDRQLALSVKVAPGTSSVAYCFSCGAQGPLVTVFEAAAEKDPSWEPVVAFIREHDGASLSVALANLRMNRTPVEVPTDDWATYAKQCARQVPVYLVERGIVKADVDKWMLGFDSQLSRAIFPVRDERGAVVGCLRRAVLPNMRPPYKDTPGAVHWKPRVFYGEHLIDRTLGYAHLVEGPMDEIKAVRVLPNVLGMMGASTGIGGERLEKLHRWGIRKLIFLFDPDKAGREAILGKHNAHGEWVPGYREVLRRQFVVLRGILPDGHDPDTCPPAQLRKAAQEARYLESSPHLTGRPKGGSLRKDSTSLYQHFNRFKQKG